MSENSLMPMERRRAAGVASRRRPRRSPGRMTVGVAVDLDALLADLVPDLGLVRDRLGRRAHALLGDRALLDDGLLRVERDLVLLLGQLAARHRGFSVRVRDRLA